MRRNVENECWDLCALTLAWMAIPAGAQRRPVLPQIDEPHPYYLPRIVFAAIDERAEQFELGA